MAIESTQSSVLSSQKPILTTTQIHSIIMSSEHISSRCASSVHRQYVDGGGRNNKKKKPINIDGRVRAYLNQTNLDLFLISLFLAVYSYHAQASEVAAAEGHGGTTSQAEGAAHENPTGQGSYTESNTEFAHEEAHDSSHAAVHAVLFPWFAQIIGIFVYYFLSRYAHALPYTAVMFVMGFSMGYSMVHHKNMETILKESLITWMAMPGQLILLVFLPGLLYIDSYHIDGKFDQWHSFHKMTFTLDANVCMLSCASHHIFRHIHSTLVHQVIPAAIGLCFPDGMFRGISMFCFFPSSYVL